MRSRLPNPVQCLAVAFVAALVVGCADAPSPNGAARPLLVFAAASLRDVAADLADEFERRQRLEQGQGLEQGQSVGIDFNFAGSNTLAQQIVAAPVADVFLSADGLWVDHLDVAGRTVAGTRRAFLSNRLVIVAHRDAACRVGEPRDLVHASYRHLALGDPRGVPAGRYARAWLEAETWNGGTLWDALAGRIAPSLDVRAALALVESDPEILGIVYKTDAVASERVEILYEFPPRPEVAITYWATLVEGGESPELGRRFLDFLDSPAAREIVERHGFTTVAPAAADAVPLGGIEGG